MKIKIKDQVKILNGRDKGKSGEVERVYEKQAKVLVKGINLVKKHLKKSDQFPKGTILEINKPLAVSRVILICPKCHKATRVGYLINQSGKKERQCKKCSQII